MKTYDLNREQMHNPVILELFQAGRARWNKETWSGLQYNGGIAKMTNTEIIRFNQICRENHLEHLLIEV